MTSSLDLLKLLPDKDKPQSTCDVCKKRFYVSRKWQRYCSNKCRTVRFVMERQESLERDAYRRLTLESENEQLRRRVAELEATLERMK